jgi:hypothetical protein
MPPPPVRSLHALSRSFGPTPARKKLELLELVADAPRIGVRDLLLLQETLGFMRAHPDDPRVLRRVRALVAGLRERPEVGAHALNDHGFPGSTNTYRFSYAVLRQMVRRRPRAFEIDWDGVDDDGALMDALGLLVTSGEYQGLEDVSITLPEWFERCRPARCETDLRFVLELLERSRLTPHERAHLYDLCDLPVVYRLDEAGTGRCEVTLETGRVHYQRRDLDRSRFPLAPRIRRPLTRVRKGEAAVVDAALDLLCARNLEIYPLFYANPRDVTWVDCAHGLSIAFVGVLPEHRSALESLYFFLVTRNGVPLAYGPAAVHVGCCELGINLFPEFRAAEIRTIYAEFMRALHHLLGVRYYSITSYGMGEGNEDALKSGAFWFYRKLGFLPVNPEVEALACEEEERMRAHPGHRSDRRTLRALSRTGAYLDLSGGRSRPLALGALGIAQTRFVEEEFGGDRALADRRCAARMTRALDLGGKRPEGERHALRALAPLLCLCGAPSWSARDRRALARIVRAKGARSEMAAARLSADHETLAAALRELVGQVG